MTAESRYAPLFEPIDIGPKRMRNRFMQVPQCNGGGTIRPGLQAAHRAVKAEGGWAAIFTEGCSVSLEAEATPYVLATLVDDDDIRNLAAMCDEIHAHGSLAGVELKYASMNALESRDRARAATVFPRSFPLQVYPRYLDIDDIALVQRYYVDAALRAREAGLDLICVYGAHSQLTNGFLSPRTNHRTDAYGGSFENRARFWRETIEQVREAVGDDCAITARFGVDQLANGGIEVTDEGARFIEHVDHLIDLWDVNIGSSEWGQDAGASRFFEENHQAAYTRHVKQHTNKPVSGVGRFTNPETMLEVLRSGQYDIIGAARPTIADPFLPAKIQEGRLDDIRECIGCNMCIARWEIGNVPIICTQNATAGEEYRRGWHPERFTPAKNRDKTVIVVGAGPAGLECAMVLGKRGMSAVHLLEGDREVGGSVNWISKLGHSDGRPNLFRGSARGLGEWHRVVDYRMSQIAKLRNIEVHTGTHLTVDAALEYGADYVIVASGCSYARDGINHVTERVIPGADPDAPWQLTPPEAVVGTKPIGERVLVIDHEESFVGASVAQHLAGQGHRVQIVTHAHQVASFMQYTVDSTMLHRDLARLGVEIHTTSVVTRIEAGECSVASIWNPDVERQIEADTVVLCTQRVANDALYRDLRSDRDALSREGIQGLFVIGDASAPGSIADAVFAGHRLAREIDSPDPSLPLPFIRERRVWGSTTNEHFAAQIDPARSSTTLA
jgi:dimethylamine/trimethylamine dehydrogenase